MRPNPLRPITRDTPAPWWRRVALMAGLAGGSLAWAASAITIAVDCPVCGPGQTFPHECPQDRKTSAAPATPDPLPAFIDEARKQHRRLVGISGLDIPDLGEVSTLGELDAALARVIGATEGEIERCEREHADLVRKGATAEAERNRLAQLAVQLTAQIEQLRREISETERDATAQIRAATMARDEILRLQKSLATIREEIRQVRNRLFPRLHLAANQGWILPPSNYRRPPEPLPVKSPSDPGPKSLDAALLIPESETRLRADGTPTLPLTNASAMTPARIGLRQDVESKLEQLPLLGERARTAIARRADAIRTLEVQQRASDTQSAQLSTLEPQRAALASRAATAKRNAAVARQTSAEYATRLTDARAAAIFAWIEWGVFRLFDQKAEALLGGTESNRKSSTWLQAWGDVAATAAELGSDRLGVITRLPANLSARGESLDGLQRDLAGTREKFGLGFIVTEADVPAPAAPYLAKAPR